MDGAIQRGIHSSDGNLVDLGNADAGGVNVNMNKPDNANDNLGVCLSEVSFDYTDSAVVRKNDATVSLSMTTYFLLDIVSIRQAGYQYPVGVLRS